MLESHSFIFRTGFRIVFFIALLLSVYLLLRGHNLPGGGFIGGLVAALSLAVLAFDVGVGRVKSALRVDPMCLALGGLLLSVGSAFAGPLAGREFLFHFNGHAVFPFLGEIHLGTPLVFDLGVYFVVVGVFCKTVFVLSEAAFGRDAFQGARADRYLSGEFEQVGRDEVSVRKGNDAAH